MVRGTGGGTNRRLLNTSNPFQISIAKSSLRNLCGSVSLRLHLQEL